MMEKKFIIPKGGFKFLLQYCISHDYPWLPNKRHFLYTNICNMQPVRHCLKPVLATGWLDVTVRDYFRMDHCDRLMINLVFYPLVHLYVFCHRTGYVLKPEMMFSENYNPYNKKSLDVQPLTLAITVQYCQLTQYISGPSPMWSKNYFKWKKIEMYNT